MKTLVALTLPLLFCFSCRTTPIIKTSPYLQTSHNNQLNHDTASCGLAGCSNGQCRAINSDEDFVVRGPQGPEFEAAFHAPLRAYFDPKTETNPTESEQRLINLGMLGYIQTKQDIKKLFIDEGFTIEAGKVSITMFTGYIPMGGCAGYYNGETRLIPQQYLSNVDGEAVYIDKDDATKYEPSNGVSLIQLALMRLNMGENNYIKMFEEFYNQRDSTSIKSFLNHHPEYSTHYQNAKNETF